MFFYGEVYSSGTDENSWTLTDKVKKFSIGKHIAENSGNFVKLSITVANAPKSATKDRN